MRPISVCTGSIGLNNKVPAHRLPYDRETGVVALEEAVDIIIDRTGEPVARKGTSEISPGEYHSFYGGNERGLVAMDRITDAALYLVHVSDAGDATLTGIRSDLTIGAKLDYCNANGVIHYTNGYQNGVVTPDGISDNWPNNTWPDSETRVGFQPVPPAEHLCFNFGRIFFSRGHLLNYTEFGMLGIYDPATNGEVFNSKVIVIAAVEGGLYVSDQEAIYYLSGTNPSEWTANAVTSYPALEWGVCRDKINPVDFGFESNSPAIVMATVNGPLLCLSGGTVIDLISKNVKIPKCKRVVALAVFDETLMIQTGE